MQVTCTNCRARYAVDPLAIGPSGRIVQCARCHDRWFQTVKLEPTPPRVPLSPEPTLGLPPPPVAAALARPAVTPSQAAPSAAGDAAPADAAPAHRPQSPFSPEAMADNFPRFAGPRPSPPPASPAAAAPMAASSAPSGHSAIDTMPIPDVVIRPSVKGAGLPALIEPRPAGG